MHEQTYTLPMLKILSLNPEFLNKVKGVHLETNYIVPVADDGEDAYFVGISATKSNENKQIEIETKEMDENNYKYDEFIKNKYINYDVIYKINSKELSQKIIQHDKVDNAPLLSIENQIDLVAGICNILDRKGGVPKLIWIRKKDK